MNRQIDIVRTNNTQQPELKACLFKDEALKLTVVERQTSDKPQLMSTKGNEPGGNPRGEPTIPHTSSLGIFELHFLHVACDMVSVVGERFIQRLKNYH